MSMFAVNRVTLFGNLTRDPDLRTTPSGQSVCDLRLAVNESIRDRNTDEWRDRANYFSVVVWGKIGEFVARECAKGTPILIEGRLRWEEWDAQDGTKRQAVKIIADKAIPVGRRNGSDRQAPPPHEQADRSRAPDDPGGPWSPQGTPGIDDDIPF